MLENRKNSDLARDDKSVHTSRITMNTRHLFAALLFLSPLTLSAQEAGGGEGTPPAGKEEDSNRRFWQAELPGGAYIVALDRICSVGKHEYIVDGGFLVTEVSIETVGTVVARFYYGEPYQVQTPGATGQAVNRRVQDVVETVKGRTAANQADGLVVKNYPTSTHAHTIEFRLTDKDNLEALFQSVNRAWITGRGVKFTIKSAKEEE